MKTTIEIDLKWFLFRQNNSGGRINTDDNVADYVFIQARTADEAVSRGEAFLDNSDSCPCCGDRWSTWIDDEDGTDEPMVYDTPLNQVKADWLRSEARLHHFDGTVEKVTLLPKEEPRDTRV